MPLIFVLKIESRRFEAQLVAVMDVDMDNVQNMRATHQLARLVVICALDCFILPSYTHHHGRAATNRLRPLGSSKRPRACRG